MTVLNMACPECDKTGQSRPLNTRQGFFGFYCENNPQHVFQDTGELMAMNPRKLQDNAPQPVIQQNIPQEEMKFSVEAGVPARLAEKFKASTNVTLAAIMKTIAQPNAFVVADEDANRISERLSQKVSDSMTLVGIVSAIAQESAELKGQVKAAKEQQSQNPSAPSTFLDANGMRQVALVLSSDTYAAIAAKAAGQGKPGFTAEMYIQNVIQFGLNNGWF